MSKISYRAKSNIQPLRNFIADEVIEIKVDRLQELRDKKDILTPEEMTELERIIKEKDV